MGEPVSPKSPVDPPDEMISREQLRKEFRDFDTQDVYQEVLAHGKKKAAKNFVVQFGGEQSHVALDLNEHYFATLMATDNAKEVNKPIRWINIWNPSKQRNIIDIIGARYGFSPRLRLTITAWDLMKEAIRKIEMSKKMSKSASSPTAGTTAKFSTTISEAEKGTASNGTSQPSSRGPPTEEEKIREQLLQPDNIATFRLMQEQMNFTSIDQEKQFICIGANWLHKRPEKKQAVRRKLGNSIVPPYHFSWFALCGDNTVLSFHESAHDDKVPDGEDAIRWRQEKLENTRSNTIKVLQQLSKIGLKEGESNYMQLTSVRKPLMANASHYGRTAVPEERAALEGSSNLFYYLFEDYSAAFPILEGSKTRLKELKDSVLLLGRKHHHDVNTKDVIPKIHKLHGELRQLKHLFTSYKTLFTRILNDKHGLSRYQNADEKDSESTREKLSTRARDRFERLRDRLEFMMLDTIQEYLDEKDSLQDTYFNLLQQKDSEATARLTRSATLLAKLSVFFLPISFLTSFYSIQLDGFLDGETKEKYWTIFGVLVGISLLTLFCFSRLAMFASDKLDGYTAIVEGKIMSGAARMFPKLGEKKERKRAAELDEDD